MHGKKPEDIPASLRAKPSNKKQQQQQQQGEAVGLLEFQISCLCDVMGDIVSATRRHTEMQQARSVEEKRQELYEEEHGHFVAPSGIKKGRG
ncbi:hypothetical protein EON64_11855, partial [archaeon]